MKAINVSMRILISAIFSFFAPALLAEVQSDTQEFPIECHEKPLVSIITSVYNGDVFIKGFLEDITQIKNFADHELILINANSPGSEEPVIREYMARHPNIVYEKLDHDPGLYAVWNYAIKMARADFITNANLDDRRNPEFIQTQLQFLQEHPEIDLVYADHLMTFTPNETFAHNTHRYVVSAGNDFSPEQLYLCLPGPQPLWRKSIHEKYGYFRADFHAAGDFEMWNRAASTGSQFKKIDGLSGLFYQNPEGLTNNPDTKRMAKRRLENQFVRGAYAYIWDGVSTQTKLLIKIPTRSRPQKFFDQLDNYYRNLSGKVRYHFLITCSTDDTTMNNPAIIERLSSYPNLTFSFSENATKVDAYNRDLDTQEFDILLAASDDKEAVVRGYDKIIVDAMLKHFPDLDGVLNFNDGHIGAACNTLPVVGKKFYDRFGYLYNPAYQALFANEELTLVSRALGKELVRDDVIIKHNHPVWGAGAWDELYYHNEGLKEQDRVVFNERRARDFYLNQAAIESSDKDWSILICTLDERAEVFEKIYKKLTTQIADAGLQDKVEVLFFKDNRENTIGHKRNALVSSSRAKYTCFVDDDDDVHPNYIKMIYEQLQKNPDCVRLVGIITTNGENPQKFVHSIAYNRKYAYENGVYYRPPNHLNPIKRDIALQFKFPEKSFGEDQAWTLAVARSGLLLKEARIDEPYYFYQYDGKYHKPAQKQDQKSVQVDAPVLQYFVTAADHNYFEPLLNFIGNVHALSFDQLGGIAVANLGLTQEQIDRLKKIEKVTVLEVEKTNPDILTFFKTHASGKKVPGWYAWKPVVVKQALELFPYVLWTDATTVIFKPLDDLFKHIKQNGYFLATIGNESDNGKFRLPLSWCTTKFLIDQFDLNAPERKWIFSQEQVMATTFGVARESADLFIDPLYELSKDLRYFADDGTTPDGFGTGRHDQALLGVYAYTHHLKILKQDYRQLVPIDLIVDGKSAPFHMTWHGSYVNDKTYIYNARSAAFNYAHHQKSIKYKK